MLDYEPNSFGGPFENPDFNQEAYDFAISGVAARYDHRGGNDHYTQAGNLFRLLAADHRVRLIDNIVNSLHTVPCDIQVRQVRHFYREDSAYGEWVARGLALDLREMAEPEKAEYY